MASYIKARWATDFFKLDQLWGLSLSPGALKSTRIELFSVTSGWMLGVGVSFGNSMGSLEIANVSFAPAVVSL